MHWLGGERRTTGVHNTVLYWYLDETGREDIFTYAPCIFLVYYLFVPTNARIYIKILHYIKILLKY